MFKNYLKIAIRSLSRQMMYSFINLIGLAVGLACSLVIFLYVYGEWSHDRHFKNADSIYRVGVAFFNMGEFANGPERLKDFLPKEFAGMDGFTRFQQNKKEVFSVGEKTFKDLAYYVDSSFFSVFTYPFVQGDPATAMMKPASIVLTESMARKYFNDESALGKTIEVGKQKELYVVTGVVKDENNHNSHLKASIWTSLKSEGLDRENWQSATVYTYVRLNEGVSETDLARALDRIIEKEVYPKSLAAKNNMSLEQYIKDENSVRFSTLALKDIYLRSKANLELTAGGNLTNLYIFSIIAVFILILAGVNFINLSTARATRRAKEVGIRKTLGTSRARLISQFLLESVLMSLLAMVISLGLAELFTFVFFWITGQQLSINLWGDLIGLAGVLIFTVIVGIIAGIYPAFYLTSFKPVNVLKGNLQLSRSPLFRNTLVVFQFSISITLIICSAIIFRQFTYMDRKDLGFTKENVLTIDNLYGMKGTAISFKDELAKHPDVINTSLHAGEPGNKSIIAFYTFQTPETEGSDNAPNICTYYGDHNYISVMGYKLKEGRDFDKDLASDTASVILNQAAVRALYLENPIGAVLNKDITVIGVVSDFHWESLRNSIAPIAIMVQRETTSNFSYSQLALKLGSSSPAGVLKSAEALWKQRVPDEPFQYHFIDDNFGALLQKEQVLGKAVVFFTALAILISCLGLFGLAAYTTEQRTKEIGIRKVLGASVSNIVLLLNKQFTKLVVVSLLIAIPFSYYATEQWLSGFAYRTTLSFWIFAAGGLLGLCISCVTVAFHSIKASQTNPSETLKCE